MKAHVRWVILLLCLPIGLSAGFAQKGPAQRTVAVVVADAHTEPSQPVPTVRISLGYFDGSVLVTEARDVTNSKGQAWLDVSEDAAERGGLRVQVEGASGLVIYQPADGQLGALPSTISVSMLPKGSAGTRQRPFLCWRTHRHLPQIDQRGLRFFIVSMAETAPA